MTVRSPRRKAAATCTRMAGFTPFQAIAGDGGAGGRGGVAVAVAGAVDAAHGRMVES